LVLEGTHKKNVYMVYLVFQVFPYVVGLPGLVMFWAGGGDDAEPKGIRP
jgi:hypothetical protein